MFIAGAWSALSEGTVGSGVLIDAQAAAVRHAAKPIPREMQRSP